LGHLGVEAVEVKINGKGRPLESNIKRHHYTFISTATPYANTDPCDSNSTLNEITKF
jgi:hypothetical protein